MAVIWNPGFVNMYSRLSLTLYSTYSRCTMQNSVLAESEPQNHQSLFASIFRYLGLLTPPLG
jgi:hypothetical protein